MHLAKPVERPVKSKVLETAEDANQKPEHHTEPNEAAPVLKCAEGLRREKEEDQIGEQKQEFHPRAVGRRSAAKKPLAASDEEKGCQRREKRRKNNFFIPREKKPQGPGKKKQCGAGLPNNQRPTPHPTPP